MQNESQNSGVIKHLFLKQNRGAATISRPNLSLKVGQGIEGDVHAHPLSPRQILIVREEDLLELSIAPGELRENIVVGGLSATSFVPGALMESDRGAAIRLTFYCEPCKRIAPLVESLKQIEKKRGILGVILKDSLLKVGDKITVKEGAFPTLSDIPYERFLNFIERVPRGKVVTYKQVITGIGVSEGYYRALPNYLKKAELAGYPAHRVVDSQGYLTPHLKEQREKLQAEKLETIRVIESANEPERYCVSLQDYSWEDSTLYCGLN